MTDLLRRRALCGMAGAASLAGLGACTVFSPSKLPPAPTPREPPLPVAVARKPVKLGLALGGGAARGFAHIGVIKVLEGAGIAADVVVGTSAGAVVGALHASGLGGFELQDVALSIDEQVFADWILGGRGLFRGEALQNWMNDAVHGLPIEKLKKPLGVTSTQLATGDLVVFRSGNTGLAVRASSAVPGVFAPVTIGNKEYVDGGLVSPVPVRATREVGADCVIAVDISADPGSQPTATVTDLLLQTFAIMGRSINRFETQEADVLVRPALHARGTDFAARHAAILSGERAMTAMLPALKQRLEVLARAS